MSDYYDTRQTPATIQVKLAGKTIRSVEYCQELNGRLEIVFEDGTCLVAWSGHTNDDGSQLDIWHTIGTDGHPWERSQA